MTNDPTPDRNDPLRALDAVEPEGNWDDVVSRSTDGELLELAPVTARRSFPRPLLAAAAVLAVVALAGGIFAVTRGDDKTQTLATDMPGEGGRVAAPAIWNSTWELVALERDGEPWEVADAVDGNPPRIVTTEPGAGAITLWACNHGSGAAAQEGDQLVVTAFVVPATACLPEAGSPLLDQEQFVVELLADRPTVAIEAADGETGDGSGAGFDGYGIGDRLILTTSKGSATFERTEIGGPIDSGTDGDQPQALWGRMWNVVSVTDGGKPKFFPQPEVTTGIQLDATTSGHLSFDGCNGSGGQLELDGDRLKVIEIGPSTMMGCDQELMDQDVWFQAFLEAEPIVTVEGNTLTLATDQATIELEAADVAVGRPIGPDPGDPADPDGSVSSPPQPPGSAGDPGPTESIQPSGPEETVPPSSADLDPAAFWDRTWNVVTITDQDRERPLVAPADGKPLAFTTSTEGFTSSDGYEGGVSFTSCARPFSLANLDGSRLMATPLGQRLGTVCRPAALADQEEWLQAFLVVGPTVTIDGSNLTLTTDQATIDLVAA